MPDQSTCYRCGYVGPGDAYYCAHCGHILIPTNQRLKDNIKHILSNLSPVHIGFLGLLLSVSISLFVQHLIVMQLSFPLSLVPLALVLGCGYAYLGWNWNSPLSSRNHLIRMLFVFLCMVVIIAVIWLFDQGLLTILSDRAHMVIYEIPGVHIESSPGFKRMAIENILPPYWLALLFFVFLAAISGNIIHRLISAPKRISP